MIRTGDVLIYKTIDGVRVPCKVLKTNPDTGLGPNEAYHININCNVLQIQSIHNSKDYGDVTLFRYRKSFVPPTKAEQALYSAKYVELPKK